MDVYVLIEVCAYIYICIQRKYIYIYTYREREREREREGGGGTDTHTQSVRQIPSHSRSQARTCCRRAFQDAEEAMTGRCCKEDRVCCFRCGKEASKSV